MGEGRGPGEVGWPCLCGSLSSQGAGPEDLWLTPQSAGTYRRPPSVPSAVSHEALAVCPTHSLFCFYPISGFILFYLLGESIIYSQTRPTDLFLLGPPHGAATAACGLGVLASDTSSPEAVRPSAPQSSSVAPALHGVCCESPPAATWLCFPSFTSFVCSKTSVGSWGGVDSTHGRRVPPQSQRACLPQRHTSVRAPHALNRSDGKGYSPLPISTGAEYSHNVPELLLSRDKAAAPAAAWRPPILKSFRRK